MLYLIVFEIVHLIDEALVQGLLLSSEHFDQAKAKVGSQKIGFLSLKAFQRPHGVLFFRTSNRQPLPHPYWEVPSTSAHSGFVAGFHTHLVELPTRTSSSLASINS